MGNIIPLMDSLHVQEYNKMILKVVIKEFNSPEDEMKKVILKVLEESFKRSEIDKNFVKENIFDIYW